MPADSTRGRRIAGWAAYGSAAVAAFGVVFICLLYAGLLTDAKGLLVFGPLNDLCVLIQYALALPMVFALHPLLAPRSPRLSFLALISALTGILGVVVFQALLLGGLMSFRSQIVYAAVSVLLVGVWILLCGVVARGQGIISRRRGVIVSAALYFGYPLWAFAVGRHFLRRSPLPSL